MNLRKCVLNWTFVLILGLWGCSHNFKLVFSPIALPDFPLPESPNIEASQRFAWQLLLDGKPDQALSALQESKGLDSGLYSGFGYVYLVKKQFEYAERNFKKALSITPDYFMAQAGLGLLYEIFAKNREAFEIYKKIKLNHVDNSWVQLRFNRVKVLLTEIHMTRAQELKNQGDTQAYVRELELASSYSPELNEITYKIATHYSEQGDGSKAIHYFEQLLEHDPHNQQLIEKLANAYEGAKVYDNALILYKRMLDQNPGDTGLINKIDKLREAFDQSKWPKEFKNIFFKEQLNREDAAALIGHYFYTILPDPEQTLIISDISGSFAFSEIIKVCANNIMSVRPDHRFDRYGLLDRGQIAVILDQLLTALKRYGKVLDFQPIKDYFPPQDIMTTHKNYQIISNLLNIGLMDLNASLQFQPMEQIRPDELLGALKKIEKLINIPESSK